MKTDKEQETKTVYAMGIDLSSDYAQVSYLAENMKEAESVSIAPDDNKYLIPMLMYKMRNVNEWYIGDEARLRSFEDDDERYAVRNLLQIVYDKEDIKLDDQIYTAKELLQIFVEKLIAMAIKLENMESPQYIAVTVEKGDKVITDALYDILCGMGYSEEKIRVINHTESFIYYTLNQKKDVWINDVALFDFNGEHFLYRRFNIMRNSKPMVVTVKEKDFSDVIDMVYLESDYDKKNMDERFLEIIRKEFYKQLISSVFLTGAGFYSDFAENSLVELCSKRRVFKGYNLFVKGACYAAMAKQDKTKYNDYIFQCAGRTKVSMGIVIRNSGKSAAIALSKAGENWYEAGARAECILDDVKTIQIMVHSPYGDYEKDVEIDLSDFPERPNKATRVGITIAYVKENECDIMVEDLGFGDFFKPSGKVIKKSIKIDVENESSFH